MTVRTVSPSLGTLSRWDQRTESLGVCSLATGLRLLSSRPALCPAPTLSPCPLGIGTPAPLEPRCLITPCQDPLTCPTPLNLSFL